nr:MAG TPA: hypothetical protein [Caudoviricetes sp.]
MPLFTSFKFLLLYYTINVSLSLLKQNFIKIFYNVRYYTPHHLKNLI